MKKSQSIRHHAIKSAFLVLIAVVLLSKSYTQAFLPISRRIPLCFDSFFSDEQLEYASRTASRRNSIWMSKDDDDDDDDDTLMDDETLLKTVQKSQLEDLCDQLKLNRKGTKTELLRRLRDHAQNQINDHQRRRELYEQRVEDGFGEDSKERYEIVGGHGMEEGDEGDDDFVVFLPDLSPPTADKRTSATTDENASSSKTTARKAPKSAQYLTQAAVTAPPLPPDVKPNEKGERVVTTYSTTDMNDLTGVAAAQPGHVSDSLEAATAASAANAATNSQPWEMEATNQKSKTSNAELEQATETITNLVQLLLAMSGAPFFRAIADDHLDSEMLASYEIPKEFIGFNPNQVPTDLLNSASQALRTGRGQVLSDVLRQFEMQAIGQDGMVGDNKEKGGGNYREVSKVRAFLEGFRRAEVRKMARETTTILLDKLVQEGVEGLDMTLATMTRSSDDNSQYGGELNDSLLDYLTDAIRQQEKKVDQLVAERLENNMLAQQFEEGPEHHFGDMNEISSPTVAASSPDTADAVDALWNVTNEEGQRVETIDPNNPTVKNVLAAEVEKDQVAMVPKDIIPETAPEQLLLLLSLLKERVKAEAAFGPDEKGRNLRLLAYCMKLSEKQDRRQLLTKDLGASLDRLDSFIELVESSVEYGDSTSHQLQPAKTKKPFNLMLVKDILEMAKSLRAEQAWKASSAS